MPIRSLAGEYLSYLTLFPRLLRLNRARPPGVTVRRIPYGSHARQHLLLFSPEKVTRKPWIFFVHGGGWRQGSPERFRFYGYHFARLGFATALPAYRLAPEFRHPSQVDDLYAAYQTAASEIGSPDCIVAGVSAGAHLGALLVYDRARQARFGVDQRNFRGYCSVCGPLSLSHCKNRIISGMLRDLLPIGSDHWSADPYRLVTGDEGIPVLCLHGRNDPLVEAASAEAFAARVGDQNAQLHIEEGPTVYHSNLSVDVFTGGLRSAGILHDWLVGIAEEV